MRQIDAGDISPGHFAWSLEDEYWNVAKRLISWINADMFPYNCEDADGALLRGPKSPSDSDGTQTGSEGQDKDQSKKEDAVGAPGGRTTSSRSEIGRENTC
jgi:hypothetical protein